MGEPLPIGLQADGEVITLNYFGVQGITHLPTKTLRIKLGEVIVHIQAPAHEGDFEEIVNSGERVIELLQGALREHFGVRPSVVHRGIGPPSSSSGHGVPE
jgi:hypothetical protein